VKHWVYLASGAEAVEVLTGFHGAHEGIPPPGTTLELQPRMASPLVWPIQGSGRLPFWVEGVSDLPDPSDWSHMGLADFCAQVGVDHTGVIARFASWFTDIPSGVGLTVAEWPVIVKGTEEQNAMRWIRNTVRGEFGGGTEQWQFKMDFGTPGADPDYDADTLLTFATAMRAVWGTWWATMSAWFPNDTTFIESGAAQLQATEAKNKDGSGGNVESSETQWASNVLPYTHGTGDAPSLPFETACAVTLNTDHRGPSGRGRFYVPAFQVNAMDNDISGCFEPGVMGTLNAATKAVFDTVRAAGTLEPIVVSERKLILNTITSIATGRVPDSQRRRRRSQDEARVTLLTPA
jgi:hypothetical protein